MRNKKGKNDVSKPIFIENEKDVKVLLKKYPYLNLVDAFSRQIKELFTVDNPIYRDKKEESYKSKQFKKFYNKNKNNFIHVYFPWEKQLVKTVKKNDYLKLKTNRNQDLITAKEQKKLSDKRIAVLGMSVGSNIAFVLTQAGISNEITIADFDELDTTNLNRILAGVHEIGLPKVVIASRKIYEDNPFAKVNILYKGVSAQNLKKTLKKKKLDLIVEEIDDIKMKIEVRLLAIKYKIPVVMITDNGDGVVLHIERYDSGYKKIFGHDLSHWEKIMTSKITKEIAGKIIMNDIVGGIDKVDPKMLKSVRRVLKGGLVSWSQLGSSALLGGVVATVYIKKIILGEDKRKYVVKNIFV